MSKTPSTDLFDLIKSLTKAEKRMFKLYAARQTIGGRNKYVKLFDAIDRQEVYDEKALIDRNGPARSFDLKSMKPYLHDLILRSLRDVARNKASVTMVRYQIDKAEILRYKGLFAQAAGLLERTKEIARQDGHLLHMLDILYQEHSLKVRLEETNTLARHEELYRQTIQTLDELRDNMSYYDLFMRIYYLQLDTFDPRNADERSRLDAIRNSPLLDDESGPLTRYGRMTFYEIHSRCCHLLSDFEGDFDYTRRKVSYFEANPDFLRVNRYEYIYAVGRLLTYCIYFERDDEYLEKLATLKKLRTTSIPYHVDLEVIIRFAEFTYVHGRCRFDEALAMVPEITEFLDRHNDQIETSTIFDFEIKFLCVCIKAGDLDGALHWLARLLNDKRLYRFNRFLEPIRLLRVVVLYELGDVEGVESSVRSVYRLLKRKDKLGAFEIAFLHFIKTLPGISDPDQLRSALIELRDELLVCRETPEGRMRLTQFDFTLWLESKIQGRPFVELLREYREEVIGKVEKDIVDESCAETTADARLTG